MQMRSSKVMESKTTRKFKKSFKKLPVQIQELAERYYKLFKKNPYHSNLNFKKLEKDNELCTIDIGRSWRAIGYIKLVLDWLS